MSGCDHRNTDTKITETSTEIITKVVCMCGHVVSTHSVTKIRPSEPGSNK
jgi:hypothetical protein